MTLGPSGATSAGPPKFLNVKEHSVDISKVLHDVTGTRHQGETARKSGKRDAKGSVSIAFDLDDPYYTPAVNFLPGNPGFFFAGLDEAGTRFIKIGMSVARFGSRSSVDREVTQMFEVEQNVIVGPITIDVPLA